MSATHPGDCANLACRILHMDSTIKPVDEKSYRMLHEVMVESGLEISRLDRKRRDGWDHDYVASVLTTIDTVLTRRGFLHPEEGAVDQLVDGLTPFLMTTEQRPRYEGQTHNRRRARMIRERFPGPFYAVDCDTTSYIYLGVAEHLRLPLSMVVIPSHNRRPGHTFVRWREGKRHLNWETLDGMERGNDYYVNEWRLSRAEIRAGAAMRDLSPTEVIGYQHTVLGIQWEHRGQYARALSEFAAGLVLFPQHFDLRRQYAWVASTAPGLEERPVAAAIEHALGVVRLAEDHDARDTLAAAYAAAGQFDQAVIEQRLAIAGASKSDGSRRAYRYRLELYQSGRAYRLPEGVRSDLEGGRQ